MSAIRLRHSYELFCAERQVSLLERAQPLNFSAELERLTEAWSGGRKLAPVFRYRSHDSLARLRGRLEAFSREIEQSGWGHALTERALELADEAAIAEAIGTPRLLTLARRRYLSSIGVELDVAHELAGELVGVPVADGGGDFTVNSSDRSDPRSLISMVLRSLSEHRCDFRVELRPNLVPLAATGDGVILIAPDRIITETDARRVALHEVLGHALPRQRARREASGLFALGTRGGGDDEEGRALLVEKRHGYLAGARARALGLRHWAAKALFDGASYCETVAGLIERGASVETAVAIAGRSFRGGGLGREIVYLPALVRVEAALAREPGLEPWLERGRLSLFWAGYAERAGLPEVSPDP